MERDGTLKGRFVENLSWDEHEEFMNTKDSRMSSREKGA